MIIIPNSRPKISKQQLDKAISKYEIDRKKYPLLIIGIRGYYKNSMGEKGKNDRNIYDDAIIVDTPNGMFSFNGNTDPSKYDKGLDVLKEFFYPVYKFDTHNGSKSQYPSICQRLGVVTVIRNGTTEHTGNFGINIHKGGNMGTEEDITNLQNKLFQLGIRDTGKEGVKETQERFDEITRLAKIDKQFTKFWDVEKLKSIREQIREWKKKLK
jgi:lysozyme